MQALLRDGGALLPDEVARWLAQLAMLQGLPFNNIVADASMLPQESIRFFYVDKNWIDALLDGALSVAQLDQAQGAVMHALRSAVGQRAMAFARVHRRRVRALRRRVTPEPVPTREDEPETLWTGLLLRSAAVANWPGLAVTAYASSTGGDALEILRLERVSPSVLLALFDGVGTRFEIAMPPQALHFGFQKVDTYRVPLRGLGGALPVGKSIDEFADVPFREDPERRVVNVRELRKNILQAIDAAYEKAHAQPPPVNPGAFALELVTGNERQAFYHQLPQKPAMPAATRPLHSPPRTLRELIEDLRG